MIEKTLKGWFGDFEFVSGGFSSNVFAHLIHIFEALKAKPKYSVFKLYTKLLKIYLIGRMLTELKLWEIVTVCKCATQAFTETLANLVNEKHTLV